MANVVQPHPQIDFHSSTLGHPPQIGLGLTLSMSSSLVGLSPHAHSNVVQPLPPAINPSRPQKRRFEQDDEQADQSFSNSPGARDVAMERSPTPERPKRAPPKRARNNSTFAQEPKGGRISKEPNSSVENQDVDVGVLLASLPTQSLLPLLNSLIQSQPTLKPLILSLIPRPSIDTALQALSQSAKRLRDAYPYSNHLPSQISLTSALGFGFATNPVSRPTSYSHSSSSLGFGSHVPLQTFGVSSNMSSDTAGGMREEYIVSRLRPHINDFVASFQSYLPYFSQRTFNLNAHSSGTPQPPRRDRCPPTETFLFLQSLTSHILAQPSLTQATLVPLILSRLLGEWKVWVEHVDEVVNRQAGMFGEETVRGWERVLDEFADVKGNGLEALREIRDSWITKVGWLVGRVGQTMMED